VLLGNLCMSNELNSLSTQKNQLIGQRSAIINSPEYNAARENVNKNYKLYEQISTEVDLANTRVIFAQANVNRDRTNQQFQNTLAREKEILAKAENTQRTINSLYLSSSATFNRINSQATDLQNKIGEIDSKIGQLAFTRTSNDKGFETVSQPTPEQLSPVPAPSPQQNQPVTAVPVDQASFVFSERQTRFLETYNKSLIDQGFNPVDSNSPEALSVVSRLITSEDTEFELGAPLADGPPLIVDIAGVIPDPEFDNLNELIFNDEDDSDFIDGESSQLSTFTAQAREQVVGKAAPDLRFKITLAEASDYFYNAAQPGILAPLRATNGVIFPYTPQVTVSYVANYTPLDIVHTNYKFYSYKNSAVENFMITADFTAQNTVEANYLLAVIHFFRSATKMFYGQDQNPSRGVPPPLCYVSGYGQYQFDNHPMVITNFTYNLPQDVDYISAYPTNPTSAIGGLDLSPYTPTAARSFSPLSRLRSLVSSGIGPGGTAPAPNFQNSQNINESTRVPTKINIQLTCLPIATRNAVSNKFSLKDYANGSLLRGSVNPGTGGGFW
jgi:hypothetical protein